MVRLKNQPKLRTNLDTDFLKLIAVLSMTGGRCGSGLLPGVSGVPLDRAHGLPALLLLYDGGSALHP